MNIAFDTDLPFSFAHGGFQIQIEQTKLALENIGVHVEWLRRWDAKQVPDLIHHFGEIPTRYLDLARDKGIKVVLGELRGGMGVRPRSVLSMQKAIIRSAQAILPQTILGRLKFDTYRRVDAAIALTPWEAYLMEKVLGCPKHRLFIVPNGVEDEFFDTSPVGKSDWIVCTATIHPRKRVLELALAAVQAKVPVWVIGCPYSEREDYYQRFLSVARAHPEFVRYQGGISDRPSLAAIYREARGFALVSAVETLSLSALEAAASGCPILLTDLPWSRTTFGEHVFYCENTANPDVIAGNLRRFYEAAPSTTPSYVPLRWKEVGEKLKTVYQDVLSI